MNEEKRFIFIPNAGKIHIHVVILNKSEMWCLSADSCITFIVERLLLDSMPYYKDIFVVNSGSY